MSYRLSPQEKNLIVAACEGKTDKETAEALAVSLGTVRTYWDRIRMKLGTINRTQSVAMVIRADHSVHIETKDARIAELESQLGA